jgi:hypothetical protein
MHIEKNVCDNIIYTLFNDGAKLKDNLKADKCKFLVIFTVHFRALFVKIIWKKSKNPSKHES